MTYRMIESLPLGVGKCLALLWEITALGIARWGVLLGLLRGGLIGAILALTMFGLTEAVKTEYDIFSKWVRVHYTADKLTQIMVHASEDYTGWALKELMHQNDPASESFVHRGSFVQPKKDVHFYLVPGIDVIGLDGKSDLPAILQGKRVSDLPEGILDKRIFILPQFRHIQAKSSIIPFMSKAGLHELVTISGGSTDCAVVGIDDKTLLIPMDEYRAAGLPTTETVLPDEQQVDKDAKEYFGDRLAPAPDVLHGATLSNSVPFVRVYYSEREYNDALRSPDLGYLKEKAMAFWWQPPVLPAGTPYQPYFRTTGDPTSFVVVTAPDGVEFILAVVTQADHSLAYSLLPKAEYDQWVRKVGN